MYHPAPPLQFWRLEQEFSRIPSHTDVHAMTGYGHLAFNDCGPLSGFRSVIPAVAKQQRRPCRAVHMESNLRQVWIAITIATLYLFGIAKHGKGQMKKLPSINGRNDSEPSSRSDSDVS
jgi:hypothetical protein